MDAQLTLQLPFIIGEMKNTHHQSFIEMAAKTNDLFAISLDAQEDEFHQTFVQDIKKIKPFFFRNNDERKEWGMILADSYVEYGHYKKRSLKHFYGHTSTAREHGFFVMCNVGNLPFDYIPAAALQTATKDQNKLIEKLQNETTCHEKYHEKLLNDGLIHTAKPRQLLLMKFGDTDATLHCLSLPSRTKQPHENTPYAFLFSLFL